MEPDVRRPSQLPGHAILLNTIRITFASAGVVLLTLIVSSQAFLQLDQIPIVPIGRVAPQQLVSVSVRPQYDATVKGHVDETVTASVVTTTTQVTILINADTLFLTLGPVIRPSMAKIGSVTVIAAWWIPIAT